MAQTRTLLAWINVVGGLAVLGSYAYGFLFRPDQVGLLWGGVPDSWRGIYTTAMFPAAIGYFPMTFFLLFRTDLGQPVGSGMRLGTLLAFIYTGMMVGSTLWMPTTFVYLDAPSTGLFAFIWFILAVVGASALAIIGLLWKLRPEPPSVAWRLALLGSLFFAFQTAILDALVWPLLLAS